MGYSVKLPTEVHEPETKPSVYRFSSFELDSGLGELRKHGTRVRLQDQPLQILVLLLEHPGELVTREQIQNALWPPGTFVDYDNAINSAMRKLREALGDNSGDPRFIETLSRRGYRFIGQLEAPRIEAAETQAPSEPVTAKPHRAPAAKTNLALLAGGAVLVLAAAVSWRLLGPSHLSESNPLVPVLLTSATGEENCPSFSPDGTQVTYSWNGNGNPNGGGHVYVKSIGSGSPLQLTAGAGTDSCPAWSPDGRTIAFHRTQHLLTNLTEPRTDFNGDIYMIPALGGAERRVAEGYFGRVSWSPDGRFLATSLERQPGSGSSTLYLVDVENGNRFPATKTPDEKTHDWDPTFSPDGRTLLFTRCGGVYRCGLYLMDLGADYHPISEPRLLRDDGGYIGGTTWTADGREVVYALSNDAQASYRLMRLSLEKGAQPRRILSNSGLLIWPAIARHGNRLAYSQDLRDVDIWEIQPGKPPHSFASSTRANFSPQYSPDGKRVAFSSERSDQSQVWVCDRDGGSPEQLTHFEAGPSGTPRWSPDGRWIAFDRQLKQGWRIFRMAADGGQVRRLTSDEGSMDETIPSWSRDGKWIYYASNRTGRNEVWKAPAQGGSGTQVTNNGGVVAFESLDGQSLYYTKSYIDSGVWALPLGVGDEKLVVESCFWRSFAVMEDGIYYAVHNRSADGSSVRFHSFTKDKDVEIAHVMQPSFVGLSVSPDRKTMLLSVWVRAGSNVVVVDNFR